MKKKTAGFIYFDWISSVTLTIFEKKNKIQIGAISITFKSTIFSLQIYIKYIIRYYCIFNTQTSVLNGTKMSLK